MERFTVAPTYDPNVLIDMLIENLCLRNDSALALVIGISPPTISRMRSRKMPVGAGFLVCASELVELDTRTLRAIMGDRRRIHRISNVQPTRL